MPAGLAKLKAVEGADVVLPVWYTLRGQSPAQPGPWELLTVMWFLEQGQDLNQVRQESISARGWGQPVTRPRDELAGMGGVVWAEGTGKELGRRSEVLLTSGVFGLTSEGARNDVLFPNFLPKSRT